MMRALCRFLLFKLLGWKLVGSVPVVKQAVVAVGPHTSSLDFPIGILARKALAMEHIRFIAKKELFKPPFGWIFRALGGFPVDRSKDENLVKQVAELFRIYPDFMLGLAPEGTREKVTQLKTGFYFMAKEAGVPLVLVGMDFGTKSFVISDPYYLSGTLEQEMKKVVDFFSRIKGRNPEKGIG